ncbi:hypothetical protein GA0115261_103718 [Streptomyces sp. OspMP-M43]|nr:hypothetical protein GA0115261_103718 [Streptomyces sp. OspMP-M43]
MSATEVRSIVDTAPNQADAYGLAFRMARVLRRAGITERYGVSVHPMRTATRLVQGWGVYLTDRYPDQAPPAGLPGLTLARTATYHQAA